MNTIFLDINFTLNINRIQGQLFSLLNNVLSYHIICKPAGGLLDYGLPW